MLGRFFFRQTQSSSNNTYCWYALTSMFSRRIWLLLVSHNQNLFFLFTHTHTYTHAAHTHTHTYTHTQHTHTHTYTNTHIHTHTHTQTQTHTLTHTLTHTHTHTHTCTLLFSLHSAFFINNDPLLTLTEDCIVHVGKNLSPICGFKTLKKKKKKNLKPKIEFDTFFSATT